MTIKEISKFKSGSRLVWRPLSGKGPFNVKLMRFDRSTELATVAVTDRVERRKLATEDWVVSIKQLEAPSDS